MAEIVCLMAAMVYEVVCRFGFNAPNIWSFDVAYMLAGTLFLLGAAYTLRNKAHVRIDFLSSRFPAGAEFWIQVGFTALLFLPILAVITAGVFDKAWEAFATRQTDYTSPWAPLMWPFYTAIGIGLTGLWLQAVAGLLQSVLSRFRAERTEA